jgi:LuxR family maltose regulon positive regulatory protein
VTEQLAVVEDMRGTRAGAGCAVPAVTAAGQPLMAAKLRIGHGPAGAVIRRRVHERLTEGIRRPFTLVTAPAGSGKTAAVGSWASAGLTRGALTWISLDAGDEEPAVFWSYVLAGLSRSGVSLPPLDAPAEVAEVDMAFLVRLSAALSERPEPVVVVLDDADVLAGAAVLQQLDFVVRHADAQLAVVLITRGSARLGLHRHRLAGSISHIGAADLTFTREEARALLRARGVEVSDDSLTSLMDQTQGWAAGLALAAIAMAERIGRPAGDRPVLDAADLTEFFLAEVLDAQPPGIRRFMLRTSVADHLMPDLADRLTGRRDSADTLAALVRTDTFLDVCAEHADCYRYHPLFADTLRAQLGREGSGQVVRLHQAAAAWFAAAGSPADAVRHLAAAGDWTAAAEVLVDGLAIAPQPAARAAGGLLAEVAGMPDDAPGPEPAVVLAALAVDRGDLDSAAVRLARARELAAAAPAGRAAVLGLAISLVALGVALAGADADGVLGSAAAVETALDQLTVAGVAAPAWIRATVWLNAGAAQFGAGQSETAAATLAKGVDAARVAGCDPELAACLGQLALVEAVRGRLARAADLARSAGTRADRCGVPPQQRSPAADLALAWVHAESADMASARRHADRAETAAGVRTDPTTAALAALVHSKLLRATGDLDGALAAIGRLRQSPHRHSTWVGHRLTAAAAALQVAAGRPDTAIRTIRTEIASGSSVIALELARAELARGDAAAAAAATAGLLRRPDLPVGVRVEGCLIEASCGLERGEKPAARAALDRALRLAEPERIRRPVVEAPPRLRSFLRQDPELASRHRWLGVGTDARSAAFWAGPAASPPPTAPQLAIIEPLTAKEKEVLRCLAALLSTEEIASAMFVSVNTVKTHIRSILRKLAASRRNEAIRRAKDLQLI